MIQIITFIITETGERRTGASTECRLNASNATHSIPYTLFMFFIMRTHIISLSSLDENDMVDTQPK